MDNSQLEMNSIPGWSWRLAQYDASIRFRFCGMVVEELYG